MPQQVSTKTVNTFVKGLITEASPLTFPDNASVDELNCSLSRTGVRGRRKGIEFEDSFELSSFTPAKGTLIHNLTWENVSGSAGVEFQVSQVGSTLYFYDKSMTPISASVKAFSVNLNSFTAANGFTISETRISGGSINGIFYVVSPAIESFYIEYFPDTDTVTTTVIVPKVRDFAWQGDTDSYAERAANAIVSAGRKYDTYNAGWIDDTGVQGVLDKYQTTYSSWPPLTHSWFSGKNASNNFQVDTWEQVFAGNSVQGNGHFILDLFSMDRSTASGVAGLAIETETSRFSAVSPFAGRIWFAGLASKKNGSSIYFSPVLTKDIAEIGHFYQEADPTSEDNSELVDSDGGVINIPSASNIKALFEWGTSLLVFAENGVWEIKGIDEVFKAGSFSVGRVRDAGGLTNLAALVDADGAPFWWGATGIFTVTREDISQAASGVDISKPSVQTFWEDIGGEQRNDAVGAFDKLNKRVFWLYGDDAVTKYKYNRVLILDIPLQAFYPWDFSDESANTNYIVGMSYFSGLGAQETTSDVFANTDDVLSSSGVNDVVVTQSLAVLSGEVEIKFMVRDGDTGSLTFATITNSDFLDWGTEDYSSFAEAPYDFSGDLTTYKHGIYVTCYFNRTETGFTGNETSGYDPIGESGCLLKAYWDLKSAASSSQQAYRFRRPVIVDIADLASFNYPNISVVTRNRIRGRGRTLKLRFESQQGKDFQLQGYEVIGAKNSGL